VLASAIVVGVGGSSLVLWWMLGSGLSVGVRLGGSGGLLGALSVVALGVQLRGFTLDGIPLLQWRDGTEAGTDLRLPHGDLWGDQRQRAQRWPQETPGLLQPRRHWQLDVGAGFAGFAVTQGLAITQEQRGPLESVVAYDLRLGSELWAYGDSTRFATLGMGIGPRATPAVDEDRVYALGATGWLRCLSLQDGGKLLWRRQVQAESGADTPAQALWATPLLLADVVVVTAGMGQPLQAFDRLTGAPRWQADTPGGDGAPVLVSTAGLPLVVVGGQAGASGHEPGSGISLWQVSWPASSTVAPKPVPLPRGRVLLGGGSAGIRAFEVKRLLGSSGFTASLLWRAPQLRTSLSAVVGADGSLYGLDDGRLVCVDSATGFRRWQATRYGQGRVLLAGALLLVQSEDGTVALVARSAEAFQERMRFRALETQRAWAEPLLHDRWLLVRGPDQAALWELPLLDD
jgi:outer membrane protein assembly factor BamB